MSIRPSLSDISSSIFLPQCLNLISRLSFLFPLYYDHTAFFLKCGGEVFYYFEEAKLRENGGRFVKAAGQAGSCKCG